MWVLLAAAPRCAHAAEAAPPAPPETPAPAVAPADAAPAETAAPAEVPAETPAPAEAPVPAGPPPRFRIVDAPTRPGGWEVHDTGDVAVDSPTLAAALADTEAQARLRRDQHRVLAEDLSLVGLGLGAATGGVLLIGMAGPPVDAGSRPDPADYAEWTDWRADTDAWESRMDQSDQRDERLWGGATLLTGAVLTGVLVPLTGQDARARAAHPALLWDRPTLLQRLTPTASVSPTQVQLAWVLP